MSYQREFEKFLNIGVVGVGSHAYRNILPALHYLPVRLKALCDPNLALARRTASEYGVSHCYASAAEMYRGESLDAVILCVSARLHPTLAEEALAAGLHVWMEKPAATCLREVDSMLAKRGDRIVTVGYKRAFMPGLVKIKEIMGLSGYSPLRSILAEYPVSVPKGGAEILATRADNNWLANGCHPISLMLALGGPAKAVTVHHGGYEDSVVLIDFRGGAIGTLHSANGAGVSQPCERYTAFCNGATLSIDNGWTVKCQRGVPFDYGKSTTFAPPGLDHGALEWTPQNFLSTLENAPLFTQGVVGCLEAFCAQALGGARIHEGSLEFAREVTAIYEAALNSSGNTIQL